MVKDLKEIRKRRQRQDFVGREEQLVFFRRNLKWDLEDDRRCFVINVSGQGGVGKTWLLRRFRKIVTEFNTAIAYTNESERDVPDVMSRIVIAGRHELDRNDWVSYEGLAARLPLDPFTEQEAHEYLARSHPTLPTLTVPLDLFTRCELVG